MPEEIPARISSMEVIERIREVVKTTVKPTWLNSVPYNFGDASAGRLKADEWRTLGTIYIPIALFSLWGEEYAPNTSAGKRLQKIFDHTMSLVSAVTLACSCNTSHHVASRYRYHIKTYIDQLKVVHPNARYLPNMHMALHIYDCLLLFGPVHAWWTFPFERLVGLLQQLSTNEKPGESSLLYLSDLIKL